MKESFILKTKYKDVFNALPSDKALELINLIFDYVSTGEMPKVDPIVQIAFIPIKQDLDRNAENYEKKCIQAKEAVQKRWERTKNIRTYTDVCETLHDYDSECDSECENDNENVSTPPTPSRGESEEGGRIPFKTVSLEQIDEILQQVDRKREKNDANAARAINSS